MSQMRRAESWRGLETQFREIWEASARLAAMSYSIARHQGRGDAETLLPQRHREVASEIDGAPRAQDPALLGDRR